MTPAALTEWRKRLALNQRQAAKALGCSRESMRLWENGARRIPYYIYLATIALEAMEYKVVPLCGRKLTMCRTQLKL